MVRNVVQLWELPDWPTLAAVGLLFQYHVKG